MPTVDGINATFEVLPDKRYFYHKDLLPQKTNSHPQARKVSSPVIPVIIEADTVVLNEIAEWKEIEVFETQSPNGSVQRRIGERVSGWPSFIWLLARKAYENQIWAFKPSRAIGLQINVLA